MGHGLLMEVSVTGAQPAAAADAVAFDSKSLTATTLHGAGATVGAGAGSNTANESLTDADRNESLPPDPSDTAARPEPAPVSSTLVSPSGTRLNVNFGQTFSVESNDVPPALNDIVPPEVFAVDRLTSTVQVSSGFWGSL